MKCRIAGSLFLILFSIQPATSATSDYSDDSCVKSDAGNLYKRLTESCGHKVAPKNCTVYIKAAMTCVTLYESAHIMSNRLGEVIRWYDPCLSWKPEEYGGITEMTIPEDCTWTPLITLFNVLMPPEREPMELLVKSNGCVTWIRPANYKLNYVNNGDNTYTGLLRYVPLTKTVNTMDLKILDRGLEYRYIEECKPYNLTLFRTRYTTLNTINGKHNMIEIEYIIKEESK